MITSFAGKHLITLQEWSRQEIDTCLDTAFDLKLKFARKIPHAFFEGSDRFYDVL